MLQLLQQVLVCLSQVSDNNAIKRTSSQTVVQTHLPDIPVRLFLLQSLLLHFSNQEMYLSGYCNSVNIHTNLLFVS